MTIENKADQTIERLRRATELGVKLSYIYREAKLSAFRVTTMLNTGTYSITYTRKKSGEVVDTKRKMKPLTDQEMTSINSVLDDIKNKL